VPASGGSGAAVGSAVTVGATSGTVAALPDAGLEVASTATGVSAELVAATMHKAPTSIAQAAWIRRALNVHSGG
jgi:hypothetical protein